jgi:hypothetical protein
METILGKMKRPIVCELKRKVSLSRLIKNRWPESHLFFCITQEVEALVVALGLLEQASIEKLGKECCSLCIP